MGGLYSSQKSNEHINYVKSSFELHKNSIEGLVQVFETQRNQFDIFLNSTDTQVPSEDNGSFENGTVVDSVDQKQNENPLHQSDIVKFVKFNQALIEWHLKKVNTSLSTLDEHMMESIRQLGYTSDNSKEAKSQIEKFNKRKLSVSGYKEDIDKLGADISKKSKENAILRQKIEELGEQIKNLQESNKLLETSEASLRNDLKKKVDTIKELGTESSKKTTENEQLRQNIKELDEQLKILRGKSSALESAETSLRKEIQDQFDNIRIQMFYPNREDTMQKVSCEFKTLLANKLNLERSKIQFIDCQTEDDVNPDMLLFIICINTSRLGTDVVSTLQKLKGCATRNAALIVFHRSYNQFIEVKKAHVLKCVSSCSSLGGMFDFVGDFYKTVYNCADNNLAIEGILNFIYENI